MLRRLLREGSHFPSTVKVSMLVAALGAAAGLASAQDSGRAPSLEGLKRLDLPQEVARASDVRWLADGEIVLGVIGSGIHTWRPGESGAELRVALEDPAPEVLEIGGRVVVNRNTFERDYGRLGVSAHGLAFADLFGGVFVARADGIDGPVDVKFLGDLDRRDSLTAAVGLMLGDADGWSPYAAWLIADGSGSPRGLLPTRDGGRGLELCRDAELSVTRFISEDRLLVIPGAEAGVFVYDLHGGLQDGLDAATFFAESGCGFELNQWGSSPLSDAYERADWLGPRRIIDEVVADGEGNVYFFVRYGAERPAKEPGAEIGSLLDFDPGAVATDIEATLPNTDADCPTPHCYEPAAPGLVPAASAYHWRPVFRWRSEGSRRRPSIHHVALRSSQGAAPVAMWREVPWNLLPSAVTGSASLSLLRNDETWRVQGLAGGLASIWRDVTPEEGSVELSLREAVEFTVQATAGGAPLAGARRYLVRPGSGVYAVSEPLGFGISGADGKVSLTLSERERSAVFVSHVTRTASAFERFDEAPPLVELGPGLAVTGRTVDPEGLPVAGVRLLGLSWAADELAVIQRHLGLSGPDGRFSLTGFAKGAASLRTDGGELEYSRRFDLDGSLDLGSIVLAAPERYWVQVVDASRGTPIPEARTLFEGGETKATDRDGLARVSPRFNRFLLVNAKGYRTARFQFAGGAAAAEANPPPGLAALRVDLTGDAGATAETPLVLRLAPAFTVEGVFVAADGVTPAASGRLVASQSVAGGSRTSNGALAADGSFSLDLEPGAYTLELTAANAGRRVLEVSGSAGETRDLGIIMAPASAWVSGTVVSPEYAPVAGARISYLRPTEFGALMARAMGRVAEVTANADGYFELHGLEVGPSSLRVEAEGFAPLEFEIEAATIRWVDAGFIELSRGRRITVRSDVDGGTVRLDPGAEHDPLGPMTDKVVDGVAVFENVPAESLRVRVLEEGVPVCERREEAGTGDEVIRCDRSTVTVTGLVTIGGQPGTGRLNWQSKVENPQGEGNMRTVGGPMQRNRIVSSKLELSAPIDDEGRYRLESMLPGEWNVTLWSDAGGMQEGREITVPDAPGEEIVVDFRYGGVSVAGTVVDAEGQPVTHATVDIFPGRQAVVTGRDGRYEIRDLAPGAYQLRARFQHSRSDLVDVELRGYSDVQSVQLQLRNDPSDDEITIRLAGAARGFCFVEMEGAGQRTVRIDRGVASTQLTPPLTDRVRVACHADGRWVLTGWQPLEPALDRGIELDPFESESSIVLTGEPSSAAVRVTGPGGWDLGSLRIWFGGATTFSVGETISNLPEGEYTLRWGNQVRTVWTERRRAAEVEIE